MRQATLALIVLAVALGMGGCNDLRDFEGSWHGPRVGDSPVLRVGVGPGAAADLEISTLDTHGLSGKLTVDGLVSGAAVESLPGAEADVLGGITFSGSPLRVFLSFVDVPDLRGQALVVIALYDAHRVEVRVLRGGAAPVYAIFALAQN